VDAFISAEFGYRHPTPSPFPLLPTVFISPLEPPYKMEAEPRDEEGAVWRTPGWRRPCRPLSESGRHCRPPSTRYAALTNALPLIGRYVTYNIILSVRLS